MNVSIDTESKNGYAIDVYFYMYVLYATHVFLYECMDRLCDDVLLLLRTKFGKALMQVL